MDHRLPAIALALLAASCSPAPPAAPRAPSAPSASTTPTSAPASSTAPPAPSASAAASSAPSTPIARVLARRVPLAVGYEGAAFALALRPDDGVVVTGYYRGEDSQRNKALRAPAGFDTFLAELDADGRLVWQRGLGAALGRDVAIDASGDLLLTGEFMGKAVLGNAIESRWISVFAARLDPTGAPRWAGVLETKDVEHARAVAVGPHGELVVAGQFFGFGRPGTDQLSTKGGADAFVAAFDRGGKRLYRKGLGTRDHDDVEALCVAPDGDLFVTGFFDTVAGISFAGKSSVGDTSDGFVARLDPEGNPRWIRKFGGPKRDGGTALALDGKGHLHLAGIVQGEADFGSIHVKAIGLQDVFVAELDADGTFLSARTFEGTKNPGDLVHPRNNVALMLKGGGEEAQWLEPPGGAFAPRTIAVHPSGHVAIGGWFLGEARFGEALLKSESDADAFVVLLDPAGAVVFADRLGGKYNDVVHDLAFDTRGRLVVAGESDGRPFTAWYDAQR